jgi:hypothetical protein
MTFSNCWYTALLPNQFCQLTGISSATKGQANGQLSISFGDLPIVIFIRKVLSLEILLFQNCLFIFELGSKKIFLSSKSFVHYLLVLSVRKEESLLVFYLMHVF